MYTKYDIGKQRVGSSARTRTWNPSADGFTSELNMPSNQLPVSATFQFPLTAHCLTPSRKLLLVHKLPWARVSLRMQCAALFRILSLPTRRSYDLDLPNVEFPLRV